MMHRVHRTLAQQQTRPSGWAILLLAASLAVEGCSSASKNPAAPLASVRIADHTPAEIGDAAVEVFREHGYQVVQHKKTALTFEKPASKLSNLAYGSWMTPVWVRVEASIIPTGESEFRLDCHAALYANKGEATEEAVRYSHVRRAPVQELLEEVAARLRR